MSISSYIQMLRQLFQIPFRFWNSHHRLYIAVILASLALLLYQWHLWAKVAFSSDSESGNRRTPRWLLRPSNFLILLATGLYIYGSFNPYEYISKELICGLLIILAFIIRYWEDDALRNVDESGGGE